MTRVCIEEFTVTEPIGPPHRSVLRMVVLAGRDIAAEAARAEAILASRSNLHDPYIADLGLIDEILPIGDTPVQLLQPLMPISRVHRWLERNDGDAGYLVVIQTEDAEGIVSRCARAGVRVTFDGRFGESRVLQLHAGDIGILVEIDQMPDLNTWHWPPAEGQGVAAELLAVDCVVPDPQRSAGLLAEVLGIAGHDGGELLRFDHRELRFHRGEVSGIRAFDLRLTDPSAAERAFTLCGTEVRLIHGDITESGAR